MPAIYHGQRDVGGASAALVGGQLKRARAWGIFNCNSVAGSSGELRARGKRREIQVNSSVSACGPVY